MKDKYNKSLPTVNYPTAMNLLARKLEIHSTASGKDAERAFNEALVHARDAAHASVFRKLNGELGYDMALQNAEDIAQSVAAYLFTGEVRAKLLGYLPRLGTAEERKAFFGKVIYNRIRDAQRTRLKGHKFVSIDDRDEVTGAWKTASFIDDISAERSLMPDETVAMLDTFQVLIKELDAEHQANKSNQAFTGWSPGDEILGIVDESDRPSEELLPKRTRQRRQKEAHQIVAKRHSKAARDDGPSL